MPKRKRRALPEVGATFERDYRGKQYRLRVVDKSGETWFEVGGRTFRSPSAAAKSITRSEVNGWVFWGIDRNQA